MSDDLASTYLRSNVGDVRAHYDLTGCARAFRVGYVDCNQFTLEK
jgi:cyclopropane fatty-acyl-phospholipid synthase-like methyltransferase